MVGDVDPGVAELIGGLGEWDGLAGRKERDRLVEANPLGPSCGVRCHLGQAALVGSGVPPTGAEGAKATGMCLVPLMKLDWRRCTSPARWMSGRRSTRRSNMTMISMRAR